MTLRVGQGWSLRLSTAWCLELSGSSLKQAKIQSCPQAAWNQHEFADLQLLDGSPTVEWLPQFLLGNWIVVPAVSSLHATSEGPRSQSHKALQKKRLQIGGMLVWVPVCFYIRVMQYIGTKQIWCCWRKCLPRQEILNSIMQCIYRIKAVLSREKDPKFSLFPTDLNAWHMRRSRRFCYWIAMSALLTASLKPLFGYV